MNESGKFVSKQRSNFSMVGNTILRDDRMSLKAKGLYALIQSYITTPNFTLYKGFLENKCKEGKKAFDAGWKELKKSGYLIQHKKKGENSKFYYEYELVEDPFFNNVGYIYIMKNMGKFKIGKASLKATRLGEYTYLPEEPKYFLFRCVTDNKMVESHLHKMFAEKRLRDGKCEWFELNDEDIMLAKQFTEQYECECPFDIKPHFNIEEVQI